MIIIKINRNSKEKQIRSKPKKKENATTKVTKIYTQKEEKKKTNQWYMQRQAITTTTKI